MKRCTDSEILPSEAKSHQSDSMVVRFWNNWFTHLTINRKLEDWERVEPLLYPWCHLPFPNTNVWPVHVATCVTGTCLSHSPALFLASSPPHNLLERESGGLFPFLLVWTSDPFLWFRLSLNDWQKYLVYTSRKLSAHWLSVLEEQWRKWELEEFGKLLSSNSLARSQTWNRIQFLMFLCAFCHIPSWCGSPRCRPWDKDSNVFRLFGGWSQERSFGGVNNGHVLGKWREAIKST